MQLAIVTQERSCSRCGSDTTYRNDNYWQWYHDQQGNVICKRCYHNTKLKPYLKQYMDVWRLENLDYNRVWYLEHPDYRKIERLEFR